MRARMERRDYQERSMWLSRQERVVTWAKVVVVGWNITRNWIVL